MALARTLRVALCALGVAALAACGGDGDDGAPPDDAPAADGGGDDGGGIDAAACVLPATPITCTAGDNGPCTAVCGNAYCHLFNQVGTLCTQPCTPGGDPAECPTGWTCNNMGRCRPP